MTTSFKLSRELHGHSQDVRAVTVLPSGHIVTGSRDNTVKIWDPLDPSKSKTLTAHQNFVASLTPLPPTSEHPTRIFASGGHDKVICVWDASADSLDGSANNNNNSNDNNNNNNAEKEVDPIMNLIGHENAVPALSTTVEGDIISGSWDKTARVWRYGECVQELKGHEHAVWAVLGLPNGDIVTGSADSTIKIWRGPISKMTCKRTLSQHKDCVRGLALVPGVGFVSCSNDETLILWSMDGEHLQTFYGHTGFVYTVAVLPLTNSEYLIISGSEDRTMKIWKHGECAQTITHPSGVWCVASSQDTQDVVSACADGVARTWTQDPMRIADDNVLSAFDASIASSSVHKSAIGDLNLDKLPGTEALTQKEGTKDGEHLIVKTAGGGAELHSWNLAERKWVKIGDVVESSDGPASKQMLHGKEYDYVFDIDVGDGMTLKLGYNSGENPYLVAQEFLWREELDQGFLDEVAQFIIKNANVSSMTLGGPTPVSDPFTGGSRYIPGSNPASRSSAPQGDAFTGRNRYVPYTTPATSSAPTPATASTTNASSAPNNYFPQQTMTSYEGGNLAGLVQKLGEFNAVVPSPLSPEEQAYLNALTNTLKDTSRYHATRVTEDQLRVVIKKLLAWPTANLLPALDLVRLLFTHTHAAELLGAIKTTPSLFEILYSISADITSPTNSMLALRAIANMFKNTGSRKLIEANQPQIMDLLLITIGSDNKNVVHASATILMNFAVLYRQQPNDTGALRALAVLAKAFGSPSLIKISQPDVALRCVIAAGTLASIPTAFASARTQLHALLPALSASQDKDLGPASRALAQLLV